MISVLQRRAPTSPPSSICASARGRWRRVKRGTLHFHFATMKLAVFSLLSLLFVLSLLAICAVPVAAQTPFYQAPEADVAGPPGTLVRQEPMHGAPDGAAAYRVLYRSTSFEGK